MGTELKPKTRKRRQRRGDEVRERILAAALECFGASGFEGASTRAIAEKADVTHTLVLYHFQSKEQLWVATVEDVVSKYIAEAQQQISEVEKSSSQS